MCETLGYDPNIKKIDKAIYLSLSVNHLSIICLLFYDHYLSTYLYIYHLSTHLSVSVCRKKRSSFPSIVYCVGEETLGLEVCILVLSCSSLKSSLKPSNASPPNTQVLSVDISL